MKKILIFFCYGIVNFVFGNSMYRCYIRDLNLKKIFTYDEHSSVSQFSSLSGICVNVLNGSSMF